MSADSSRDQELKQRELDLKERELKIRMRELEAELKSQRTNNNSDTDTVAIPNEMNSEALDQQRKLRKFILFAKLALLATGVAVTVVVLNVLLFPIIVMTALIALLYGAYVLFIKEKPKAKDTGE